ncbi:M18 family aminopeptidase [Clostridia bacterium]|nr:M18 family aminopeptidase [Clostridia bacterium]
MVSDAKLKELQNLTWELPHIYKIEPGLIPLADEFAKGYKYFLDQGKTERECVREAEILLKKAGYQPFSLGKKYQAGDKFYCVNRNKAMIFGTLGTQDLEKGIHLSVAHIDSPRLDLKQVPLYEDHDIGLAKTHYYGGVRKYQWGATPLALHGIVVKANGEVVEISIGEKEDEPVFCVTDLLPHLAQQQNKRTLEEGLKGEELNLLVGSIPYFEDTELKEKVKLNILVLLNERYGITERDLARAEIEIVPAAKARDVGFDTSLIGSYGQDDRVCAYAALMAEIETKNPKYTSLCVLADKEEIGSTGNTGLDSFYLLHFLEDLAENQGANARQVMRNSKCLSADVGVAYDPTFPEVVDSRNCAYMNRGCILMKYTGSRGKGGSSDTSAEYLGYLTRLLDQNKVFWQTGELGAVDVGGGGTVAKYVASLNMEVIDIGVPVLSMHSPFELTAKLDVYQLFQALKCFAADEA